MDIIEKIGAQFCPNITYVAIGSAHSITGGPQQNPPFLMQIMENHAEFNFEIILIDPELEEDPEIVKYIPLSKVANNCYSNKAINNSYYVPMKGGIVVYAIREYFSYKAIIPEISEYQGDKVNSANLLFYLINRTIKAKECSPDSTYLLFVHDFSGRDISKLASAIGDIYRKTINYDLFNKNVLIDLNYKLNNGCYIDLNSVYFGPHLINQSESLEIFNPFVLSDPDTQEIIKYYESCNRAKILTIHSLMLKWNKYAIDIIPSYRKMRLATDYKQFSYDNIKNIVADNVITTGLCGLEIELAINSSIDSEITTRIIKSLTENLLSELLNMTKFYDFNGKVDNLFSPFFSICNEIPIKNPYELVSTYKLCQENLTKYLFNGEKNNF